MPSWSVALGAAAFLVVTTGTVLRRTRVTTGAVGAVVAASSLVALSFEPRLAPRVGMVAVAGAVVVVAGLVAPPGSRWSALGAGVVAGGVMVAAGQRVHATGVEGPDAVATVLWIALTANAVDFLARDRLAAGCSAVTAAGSFLLAIMSGQPVVATFAAALVGACVGFLALGANEESLAMGRSGRLFLGFALGVLCVEVHGSASQPLSFGLPLMLLGVPLLEAATVVLSRMRRGAALSDEADDHLADRLVTRGLSPGAAPKVLTVAHAALVVAAVAGARKIIPLTVAAVVALALIGALALTTTQVPVHSAPVLGFSRRAKLGLAALVLAVPLAAIPAVLGLVRAVQPARDGQAVAKLALESVGEGDAQFTARKFAEAESHFTVAQRRLEGPLVSLGLGIPGLSTNLHAARSLISEGRRLAATGSDIARMVDGAQIKVQGGRVPVGDVRALGPKLASAAAAMRQAERALERMDHPFLAPPIDRAVDEIRERVVKERPTLERAAAGVRLLPDMVGAETPRRYFLAFQNNTELRGSGGLIGNFAVVVADGGRLRVERFGRLGELNNAGVHPRHTNLPREFLERWRRFNPTQFWQQINVSPDFPTTGRAITEVFPQSGGVAVDGVIAIDPVGLSSLLTLTGPVMVEGWPEPISSANVVDVTLRDAYARFTVEEERVAFLGQVSQRVAEAFTRADLGNPPQVIAALSQATRHRHLMVYMVDAGEQRLMGRLGADGAVPEVSGDSVLAVNQNLAANKVDYYLRRKVKYDVTVEPDGDDATVTGRVAVTLTNGAPSSGAPQSVIGPYGTEFRAGENRTYLSVYSPFPKRSATIDGRPADFETHFDLDRVSESVTLSLQSNETKTVDVEVAGRVRLAERGWYRLDLLHQPFLVPDDFELAVRAASGWHIAEVVGLPAAAGRVVTARMALDRPQTVWLRFERQSGAGRFWENLRQ